MYNFTLINCDTDSITISKPDNSPFSVQEQQKLLKELNSLFPEKISWADDGYFQKVIVFKAKNYILWDGEKIKSKGSALKDGKKEQALKDFIQETVQAILNDKENFQEIYHKYIKEALDIKDIKRWSSRKTLTHKTYSSSRPNETKVIDAIKGTDYKNGDRIWTFFKEDGSLELVENFNGEYDKMVMVKKVFTTSKLFASVLDHKMIYLNYSLKKNLEALEKL